MARARPGETARSVNRHHPPPAHKTPRDVLHRPPRLCGCCDGTELGECTDWAWPRDLCGRGAEKDAVLAFFLEARKGRSLFAEAAIRPLPVLHGLPQCLRRSVSPPNAVRIMPPARSAPCPTWHNHIVSSSVHGTLSAIPAPYGGVSFSRTLKAVAPKGLRGPGCVRSGMGGTALCPERL